MDDESELGDVSTLVAPEASPPDEDHGEPDLAGDSVSVLGVAEYLFDEGTRSFLLQNEAGKWIDLSETAFRRHLKKIERLRDKPDQGKVISALDERISDIEKNHRVEYAGPLAGWRAGLQNVAGRRILVTEAARIIEPVKGEWPVLAKFFEWTFCGEELADEKGGVIKFDQREHVWAWIRHAYESLREGHQSNAIAMAIAGDVNTGKSMFALLLQWMLGGKIAMPYRAMIGDDAFNNDLATAPLWLIDDENQSDTKLEKRQHFGGEIKMAVATNQFRLRAMHKNPITVSILRRLLMVLNIHGTRLLVLPPWEGDIRDKMSLLKAYGRKRPAYVINGDTAYDEACWPAPMPTRTEAEKKAYRDTLRAELPGFLWWLLQEWKMPSHVTGGRFVVPHFHHPAIVTALQEFNPAHGLWEMLLRSRVVFEQYHKGDGETAAYRGPRKNAAGDAVEWRGSASALSSLLRAEGEGCQLTLDERRKVKVGVWMGRDLDLCREVFGEKFCHQETPHGGRVWVLRPRPEDRVDGEELL